MEPPATAGHSPEHKAAFIFKNEIFSCKKKILQGDFFVRGVLFTSLFYFGEDLLRFECLQKNLLYIIVIDFIFQRKPLTRSSTLKKSEQQLRYYHRRSWDGRNFRRNSSRENGGKRSCYRAVNLDRRPGNRRRSFDNGRHEPTKERHIFGFH